MQRKRHSTEEVRITLKSISSLTYNCTDEHCDALLDLSVKLDQVMTDFKSILPHEDGILLRPQIRKKLKLSSQKKAISALPLAPRRGRKKQDADRVGRRAQTLRKVNCVMLCIIVNDDNTCKFIGCSKDSEEVQKLGSCFSENNTSEC
jgi:hypothetical protein